MHDEQWNGLIAHTIRSEGGDEITDDPSDAGGLTKYGISQKAYPGLDIANLTIEDAVLLYRRDYMPSYLPKIESWQVASRLYDLGVNMGPAAAAKLLQMAANEELGKKALVIDGQIGPASLKVINECGDALYDDFIRMAAQRYCNLAAKRDNIKYLRGWILRLVTPIEG